MDHKPTAPPSTVASMVSLLREPVTRSELVKVRALAGQAIDHLDGRAGQ